MTFDIKQYDPKKELKYSAYIYRFLKKQAGLAAYMKKPPRIVNFKDSAGWRLGWFMEGCFVGTFLTTVENENIKIFSYSGADESEIKQEIPWRDYHVYGKCAIWDAHDWQQITRNSRRCRLCGTVHRRYVKTVRTVERKTFFETVKPLNNKD